MRDGLTTENTEITERSTRRPEAASRAETHEDEKTRKNWWLFQTQNHLEIVTFLSV